MANTTAIDSVVDPIAEKQFNDLKESSKQLRTELVQLLETAIKLNATLGGSTPAAFTKNVNAAEIATQKLIDAQNKAAISATKLQSAQTQLEAQQARQQAAQDKATASAQKALSPYQQLSKELDNLRAKAKDVGVQFGIHSEQFKSASKPVQELDERLKGIDRTLGQSQRNVGNYGNIFSGLIRQTIPFGDSTIRVSENLKNLGVDADTAIESLTGLGAGFASVAVGTFLVAIASATYYLTQFKETSELVEVKLAGLKAAFSDIGKTVVESVFSKPDSNKSFGDVFVATLNSISSPLSASPPKKNDAAERGEKTQRDLQILEHKKELENAANAELQIEAEKFRILSSNRTLDISKRQEYLTKAQEIEKEILKTQQETASKTIKTALEVGFLTSSLNAKQIEAQKKALTYAASIGDLQPAQELALNGTKFTSAGFELYKQGLEERRQALQGANQEELRLQADKNNMELRADRALAQAQNELDKARIESVQQVAKLTLQSTTASNTQKLRANKDFVNQSIALIKLEEQNQLETAGLGAGRSGKDNRVEAIKRAAIVQEADNKITAVRAQGLKTRQELLKNSNDVQSRLNKANIQAQIDNEQLTLNDITKSYDLKLIAQKQYVENSKKLIEQSRKDAIVSAGLPTNPKNDDKTQNNLRLAIETEFQNQKNAVIANGERQELELHKKMIEELITLDNQHQQEQLEDLDQGAIVAAQILQDRRDKAINDKNIEFEKGKISEKKYNREILAINDQFNIDRLSQELTVQKAILAIQEGTRDVELTEAKERGATPQELALITANANKGINSTKNKIGSISGQLGNAVAKQGEDHTKGDNDDVQKKRKDFQDALGYAEDATKDIRVLIDKNYENQISKLEKIGQKIQENAEIEKSAVERSLDTQSNKARALAIIDAQTASQQKSLQAQISAEKQKQARADKVAAIAEIILNTAIAVSKVLGQTGIFGLPLVPIVTALGALQLAVAVATPIPQFAKGGTHKGGLLIYGEQGREKVEEPGKSAYYSPGVATLAYAPAGTKITPNNMLPVTPKWESNHTGSDNRDVVAAIDRLARKEQPKQRGAKLAGWVEAQRQADAWNRYTNNHFR